MRPAAGLSRLVAVAAIDGSLVAAGFPFSPCADLFSQSRQLPGAPRFVTLRGFAVAGSGPHWMRWPLRAFFILIAALCPYPWRLVVADGRAAFARLGRSFVLQFLCLAHAGLRELFRDAALARVRRPITE